MPPDLHHDQELVLKKRARRRLVGAVALVILMLIILPRILLDRAALAPREAVKISMPEMNEFKPMAVKEGESKVIDSQLNTENSVTSDQTHHPETPATSETSVLSPVITASKVSAEVKFNDVEKNTTDKNATAEDKVGVKSTKDKSTVEKVGDPSRATLNETNSDLVSTSGYKSSEINSKKANGNFSIQIGVFSDAANVKLLQAKLKKIGLSSHTENVSTEKGEKIRLKAGSFSSRSDAVSALSKLQSANLSGMVVSND
jgi:DedD protein